MSYLRNIIAPIVIAGGLITGCTTSPERYGAMLPPAEVYISENIDDYQLAAKGDQITFTSQINDELGVRNPGVEVIFMDMDNIAYSPTIGANIVKYFGEKRSIRAFGSEGYLNDGLGVRVIFKSTRTFQGIQKEGTYINIAISDDIFEAQAKLLALVAAQSELNIQGKSIYDLNITNSEIERLINKYLGRELLATSLLYGQSYDGYVSTSNRFGYIPFVKRDEYDELKKEVYRLFGGKLFDVIVNNSNYVEWP